MIEVRNFSGKLNFDDNAYRVPKGDYTDALNITRDAQGDGQDMVVSNIVGNQIVEGEYLSGYSKVIGNFADKTRNRVYYFAWNSNGFNRISYYDLNTETIIILIEDLTDTNDVPVLKFNPSWRINHIDIVYRDEGGDLLFWTDGLNPPSKINVETAQNGGYGTIIRSYLDVAKEPPATPPYCVYEDNSDITVNNLNNKQFKFKYRYVFDDLEKSVTSAQCEVPIPKNYSNQNTVSNPTKNSSIFILMDSGPANVTKIEILGSQSQGVNWSDFFLIKVLDKSELNILNNDTAQFKFFNNQAYSVIPVNESIQPFDNVPQKAYTQSLPNGSVLDYGAITENYNLINSDYRTSILNNYLLSSRINQTALIKLYAINYPVFGLKIVVAGNPSIGDIYNINYTNNGSSLNFSITASGSTTASLKTQIQSYFLGLLGYSVTTDSDNNLLISNSPNVLGVNLPITVIPALNYQSKDSQFAYDWFSRYSYGVVYFDEKGRTNGVVTSTQSSFETQQYDELNSTPAQPVSIPEQLFSIYSRPPEWATYFEIVRTKNLTKSNFLYWVSERTYKDNVANQAGYQYAYISINTLTQYIIDNPEAKTLGYEFTVGDRIRFIKLYSNTGSTSYIYNDKDYQIVDSLTNPIVNGVVINGQVLKIVLPATSSSFDFGTDTFANYLIEIYTPGANFSNDLNFYYEFGEKYSIGNAGTNLAFHYGMTQNQTDNLSQPALYQFYKGDSYFRYRLYPAGGNMQWAMNPGTIILNGTTGGNLSNNTSNNPGFTPIAVPTSWWYGNTANYPGTIIQINDSTKVYNFLIKGTIKVKSPTNQSNALLEFTSNNPSVAGNAVYSSIGPLVANVEKTTEYSVILSTAIGHTRIYPLITVVTGYSSQIQVLNWTITITENLNIYQGIIDPNFSDTYDSSASPNGRPWIFNPNASQSFNPTLIRFGGEFQPGTNVNNINRFYDDNFDVYDRSRGSIKKMFIEGRNQYVFQEFDVGVVTVLTQIVRDTAGNPLSAESDRLLNKIVYPYIGQYGIGNVPESFAYGKRAKYFVDNNKGVVCRLSTDGITPLSILYKANAFFVAKTAGFNDNLNTTNLANSTPTIYGAFDAYTNKYIIAMSEINRLDFYQEPYTLSFLESRDATEGFESFLSFYPENMGAINNLFITFLDGNVWTHNNNTHCNFYDTQYGSSISAVFNDNALDKKSYLAIMQTGNTIWYCPSIISQLNSYGSTPQQTSLNAARFKLLEGQYNSAILRDANSAGGIINGDTMKGNYITIKFQIDSASSFYYINTVSLKYNNSPLNTR